MPLTKVKRLAKRSLPRLTGLAAITVLLTSCTVVSKKSKDGEYIFSVKSDGTGVNILPILPTATASPKSSANPVPTPALIATPEACTKFTYQPSVIGIPAEPGKVIRELTIPSCKIQKIAIHGEKGVKVKVDGGGTGIAIIRDSKVLIQSSKATKGTAYLVLPTTGLYTIEAVSRNNQTYSVGFTFDWSATKKNPSF